MNLEARKGRQRSAGEDREKGMERVGGIVIGKSQRNQDLWRTLRIIAKLVGTAAQKMWPGD